MQANANSLNDLDSALKELGMLASSTNSRNEYIKEISATPCTSSVKINTKYISMIACGKLKIKTHSRFKPYMPRIRNRTKSENNDSEITDILHKMLDVPIDNDENFTQLKKAKSLESILNENMDQKDFRNMHFDNLPELESVSECIQNLRVAD